MADRVLMVNDISEAGGGATAMLDVARVLLDDGIELHLVAPDGPLRDDARALGIETHAFEFTRRRLLRGRLPRPTALAERVREGRRLARLAADVGADLVHTGALVPHLDGLLCSPTLWHLNGVHPPFLFAGPLPDAIVAVSEAALAPGRWRAGVRRVGTVVPNGIDTERFAPPVGTERKLARAELGIDDEPVIATVARLEPLKGIDTVIEAAARSSTRPVVLVVGDSAGYAGGDTHARQLRRLADRLEIDVRFLGARSDVETILHAADVFAFGSRWEAFGLAVAEAASTGLPVVTTPGCADVGGVVVESADEMAAAIDALYADPDRRERLGAAGRERVVTHFDRRRLPDRLLPVYRSLLSR